MRPFREDALVLQIIVNFELEYHGDELMSPVLNTLMTPDRPMKIKFTPRSPDDVLLSSVA